MNKEDLNLAVIVLNYNKKDDLLLAIASILRSDYSGYGLVVVDNNSTDGSAQAVETHFPDVSLIKSPENGGVSKGRNLGWSYARQAFQPEYVIFLDDDTEVTESFLSTLVAAFRSDEAAGVLAGKAFTSFETNTLMSVGISVNLYNGLIHDIGVGEKDIGQYDTPCYLDACGGFAFMVRAKLFDDLAAFDERYSPYGWEDVDFCLRARKVGSKVKYIPDAVVCHKGTKAGRKPKAGYERHKIKNYLFLLRQHATPLQKLCCLVCVPMKGAYIFLEMLFTGNAGVITSQLRGFYEGLVDKPPKS